MPTITFKVTTEEARLIRARARKERITVSEYFRAAREFPEWCRRASWTTDAHLIQLADSHGARLATLDADIPGAFLIPSGVSK
jgi:hypothetical protein